MHHYFKILFIYLFIYLFIHLFGSSEVSILSFVCARKVLYYLNNASSHFCFGYFWDRILIFAWVSLECDLSMYTCCLSWDDRCAPSCLIFPLEMGLANVFPGLAWNHYPSDLCLWSGYNYRREPLAPSTNYTIILN
jgi:hypothetical protein